MKPQGKYKLSMKITLIILFVAVVMISIVFLVWHFNTDEYLEKEVVNREKCETKGGDYCQNRFKGECVLDCNRIGGEYFKFSSGLFGTQSCSCKINGEYKPIW